MPIDFTTKETKKEVSSVAASNLAKLLAVENVSLIFDDVPTAFADMEDRMITLPTWLSSGTHIADMIVGHEVSHLLHTPSSPEVFAEHFKYNSVRIVEDHRVDTRIKMKYPGLKRDYELGATGLVSRDFFKVRSTKKSVNDFSFLNRLNIWSKVKDLHGIIEWSPEEKVIVNKMDSVISFEDTLQLAEEIKALLKEQKKEEEEQETKKGAPGSEPEDSGREDTEAEESDDTEDAEASGSEESDETEDTSEENEGEENDSDSDDSTDPEDNNGSSDSLGDSDSGDTDDESSPDGDLSDDSSDSDEVNDSDEDEGSPDGSSNSNNSDETETEDDSEDDSEDTEPLDTEDSFTESMKAESGLRNKQFETTKTLKDFDFEVRTDVKDILQYIDKTSYVDWRYSNITSIESNIKTIKTAAKILSKEFEMRKRSQEMMNVQNKKTGNINVGSLPYYKIRDDIFSKKEILETIENNHKLVIYVDTSGSMAGTKSVKTLEQLLILTEFCLMSDIKFDVFCFSTFCFSDYEARNAGCVKKPVKLSPADSVKLKTSASLSTAEGACFKSSCMEELVIIAFPFALSRKSPTS